MACQTRHAVSSVGRYLIGRKGEEHVVGGHAKEHFVHPVSCNHETRPHMTTSTNSISPVQIYSIYYMHPYLNMQGLGARYTRRLGSLEFEKGTLSTPSGSTKKSVSTRSLSPKGGCGKTHS